MWTRQLLKENAKIAFKRNYWTCVAVSVIAMLLGGGVAGGGIEFNFEADSQTTGADSFAGGIPGYLVYMFGAMTLIAILVGLCVSILLSNIVTVGCNRYFLENREHKTDVGQIFYGFKEGRYGTNVWIMFLRELYIFGWSLLFIIPGIVKAYSYMLVPFILAENSDLDKDRVFQMSRDMMDGHKMEAFVLELSFFGWNLLGALTMGMLNIFYVNPYIHATMAEFYSAIKAEGIQRGVVMPGELPGVGPVFQDGMNFNV
ncbi:MAG: DUF975 family protein [Tyzzerella sp.]|nr:DUF975 family protein [Tyzzerella sp.]